VGSANINDRSLAINTDTEVSLLLGPASDGTKLLTITSRLAGAPHEVCPVVHSLRRRLWRAHLGLPIQASSADWISWFAQPSCAARHPTEAPWAIAGWSRPPSDPFSL